MDRSSFLPGQIDRSSWGAIFTDINLWRPVVRRICQSHQLGEARAIEAGYPGSCVVFIVDRSAVVKIYPPIFAADFDRERIVYATLQDRLPHMPRVLAEGVYHDRIEWPYLVFSFCPGKPIREVAHLLSENDKRVIGRQLGSLIRKLHGGPIPESLFRSWEQWRDFLLKNRERTLRHLQQERPFSDRVVREVEQFLAGMEPVWLAERPLCLLNADLTQDHLLLLEEEGRWRVSAVIDWADAEVGVPDYEWIPLWHGLCQQDQELFRAIFAAYDPQQLLEPILGERLLAFTFLHRFGGEIVIEALKKHGWPPVHRLLDLERVLLPNVPGKGE